MADYIQFSNIVAEVERAVKKYKSSLQNLVKMVINMVYLNEVLQCDDLFPLFWLIDHNDTLAAVDPATISGITAATPPVVTVSAAHGLNTGDLVSIYNVVGMTEVNNRTFRAGTATPTGTTLQLLDLDGSNITGTGFTAYSSGGTVHHRGLTLATNVKEVLAAQWHDQYGPMEKITALQSEEDTTFWNDQTSRPERFFHRKRPRIATSGSDIDQIIWGPGCGDNYDLRFWFHKYSARMSSDTDVPDLPHEFHDTIIAGAITRLAEYNVQVESQVIWPRLYASQLAAIRTYNRRHWDSHESLKRIKPYLL